MMSAPPIADASALSTNFTGWSAAMTVAYSRKFITKLTGHAAFQEPWPPWVTSLLVLAEKSNTLETVSLDAESHDKYKVAHRNALTLDLKKSLKSSLQHVEMVAQGNAELLRSLGLNLKKPTRAKRTTPPPMLAPQLTVTQSKKSSFLDGKVIMCPGARMFQVQITDGDPSVEANWVKVDIFTKQTFEISGKEPGKTYYLRARCYGPSGTGPWSAIVAIICL
jgi:hypothetical protein